MKQVVYELNFKTNADEELVSIEKNLKDIDNMLKKLSSSKDGVVNEEQTKKEVAELEKMKKALDLQYQIKEKLIQQRSRETKAQADLSVSQLRIGELQKKESLTDRELIELNRHLINVRSNLNKSTAEGSKEYDKFTKEIKKNDEQIKNNDSSIGRFQRNVGNYVEGIKNYVMGFIGFTAIIGGLQKLGQVIAEYVKMAEESIINEEKLTVIMKQRMSATDEEIQSIINLTTAQQELGVVEGDVQVNGAQQLATFLKQKDSLNQLIPAMNDLLAQQNGLNATSEDAKNVANLLGKAMEGNVGALKKVGISFTDAEAAIMKYGTESERAAMLSKIITNNVGNMNEELAKTDLGRITNINNRIGDIKENIGKDLIPMIVLLKEITLKAFIEMKDVIDDVIEPIKLITDLRESFRGLNTEADQTPTVFEKIGSSLKYLISPLRGMIKWSALLIEGLRSAFVWMGILEAKTAAMDAGEKSAAGMARLSKESEKLKTAIADLEVEFELLDDKTKNKFIKDFEKLNKAFLETGNMQAYADGLKKILKSANATTDGLNALDESIVIVNEDLDKAGNKKIISKESVEQAKKGLIDLQDQIRKFTDDPIAEGKTVTESPTFLDLFFGTDDEMQQKIKSIEMVAFMAESAMDIISNLQTANMNREITALEKQKEKELKIAGENADKKKAIEEKYQRKSDALKREYAKKEKARAIISIAISTAMAIAKVWSEKPNPIYAGIMTALLVGVGASQAAAVASQPILASGGLLKGPLHAQGGIQYSGSEVEGNEFVMNRASTARYLPLLNSLNAAGNSIGRSDSVDKVEVIDYNRLARLINDKKVYVTTKDINESLDYDNNLKIKNTL